MQSNFTSIVFQVLQPFFASIENNVDYFWTPICAFLILFVFQLYFGILLCLQQNTCLESF